jgi:hypothetical protein
LAPAILAPEGSVTVPRMVPVVTWAKAMVLDRAKGTATTLRNAILKVEWDVTAGEVKRIAKRDMC